MPIVEVFQKPKSAPVKIWTDEVEHEARKQLENTATLPFIHHHIAVMPDVHWGMGSTVGSVIPTRRAIVPAAVGVDIGCGMIAAKLNLCADQLPDNLLPLRTAIEQAVPHGRTDNGGPADRGSWTTVPDSVASSIYTNRVLRSPSLLYLQEEYPDTVDVDRALRQLGTLGTGNHFIELCLDTDQNVWVMLHSGSRGSGNRLGSYFIAEAKELMERFHIPLADPNLAYIPDREELFGGYWEALLWAQDYATVNRYLMLDATLGAIRTQIPGLVAVKDVAINCHHNYVSQEKHFGEYVYVTRKGAVRVRQGELGIIPGSMGARSFIVQGKGNRESFDSCSHGAGRSMSRTEAKRRFSPEDLRAQTQGVECRKDADVIDEIPGAYKDIQKVIDHQSDLIDVVAELKQVVCVKG